MPSYVDEGEGVGVEVLMEEVEGFQAQVAVTFDANGGVKMGITLPSAEACQQGFGVAVDGNMVVDLVFSNEVDGIGEVRIIICKEHDDVMESNDSVEDSCCLCPERTHLGEGAMDVSFSACENALGQGCDDPCVSPTVSMASIGHEDDVAVG